MSLPEALSIVITAILAIWAIRQTPYTKRLEQEVYQLNAGLDQSIQRLQRAREAVIQWHGAYILMLEYKRIQNDEDATELYIRKYAEHAAYDAELVGLARAINDKALLEIINMPYGFEVSHDDAAKEWWLVETEIKGRAEHLHTRISQLLEEKTRIQRKGAMT